VEGVVVSNVSDNLWLSEIPSPGWASSHSEDASQELRNNLHQVILSFQASIFLVIPSILSCGTETEDLILFALRLPKTYRGYPSKNGGHQMLVGPASLASLIIQPFS